MPPSPEDVRRREADEQCVRLMQYLFHRVFCPAEGIAQDAKSDVLPVFFLNWCETVVILAYDAEQGRATLFDGEEHCAAAGVPASAWDQLAKILANPARTVMVTPVWFQVVLGDRPTPRHPLKEIIYTALFRFEDGALFPLLAHVDFSLPGNGTATDGLLASLVHTEARAFSQTIAAMGLDGMHDHNDGGGYGGEYPFQVLMGAMLQVIPQLKPEVQEPVKNYMRLCQALIAPPRDLTRTQAVAVERALGPSKLVGGWD